MVQRAAAIKTLVILEEGVDPGMLQSSMPPEEAVQVVGIVEGLEESWRTLQETPADLLVVACGATPTGRCTSSTAP